MPAVSTRCWSCGTLIAFVRTSDGRRVSIDLEPNPDGIVVIDDCGVAHIVSEKGAEALGGRRHTLHTLTCWNAWNARHSR